MLAHSFVNRRRLHTIMIDQPNGDLELWRKQASGHRGFSSPIRLISSSVIFGR